MLGQLLDALERNNLADNTLLIATSDNGAEHRPYPPLRESKRSIYEGGHRVPFVVRWPGVSKPGSVSDGVGCLNDLMATVADIVHARLPGNAGEDSVSLLPLLRSSQTDFPLREATVHQSAGGDLAIRKGSWKLIFHSDGHRELFHLQDDLSEERDVFSDNPEVVEHLTRTMQNYIDRGRSARGEDQQNDVTLSLTVKAKNQKKSRDK